MALSVRESVKKGVRRSQREPKGIPAGVKWCQRSKGCVTVRQDGVRWCQEASDGGLGKWE